MRRISIILLLILTLGIAAYFFKKTEKAPIITQSEIRALSIKIGADTAEVRKTKGKWEITEINDAPVQDTRLNSGLINHIIDILKTVRELPSEKTDPAMLTQHGLADPKLALSIQSAEGEEAVLFGKKDSSGSRVYALFVKKGLLTQVPSTLLDLLEGKTIDDLRIRTVFTFEPDDVIRFEQMGPSCAKLSLLRDGDHWSWLEGEKLSEAETEAFLKKLLATKYLATTKEDGIDKLTCTITLTGLAGKNENIDLFERKDGKFIFRNTTLAGFFELRARLN